MLLLNRFWKILMFLGEKQILINLTFSTVKFSKETETDTSLRQRAGLFPNTEDTDWCAPDSLRCEEDVTEKALFCNTFDFTKSPLHPALHVSVFSANWVLLCPSDVRILSRVLLKPSAQRGWDKGGCLTVTVKKLCLCLQTTIWLSHGCQKAITPSCPCTGEDECMQNLIDWQLIVLSLTTRVSTFVFISSFVLISHQGNLVRPPALQNNWLPLLFHAPDSNKTSLLW